MRDNAKQGLAISRLPGSSGQGRTEATLMLRDHALNVPTTTVQPFREAAMHLLPVPARRQRPWAAAWIHRNDRRTHRQFFPTDAVVLLGVIRRVGVQAVDGHVSAGLANGGQEVRRVVARAFARLGCQDQMAVVVTDQGELRIASELLHPALPGQEVAADMVALQPRGINGRFGPLFDQAAGLGVAQNRREQSVKSPFFRSRCSA